MRERYDVHHGKYESPMAHYAYSCVLEGMSDESWSSWTGEWADRLGKRIVWGDDRGFVYLLVCKTVAEAEKIMADLPDGGD